MNQNQITNPQKPADEIAQPAAATMEITDLEPEQDVSVGMRCSNNLKQIGLA